MQNIAASYFPSPQYFIDRIVDLIRSALSVSESEGCGLSAICYTVMLEACLHSHEVWNYLTSRDDITELHVILFTDPREALRHNVVLAIKSILGGLPS